MIDTGMGLEAASHWLPMYLAAEEMNASHPLRETAFAQADAAVIASFEACVWTENIGTWSSDMAAAREAAGDVIEVLRGCAVLIACGDVVAHPDLIQDQSGTGAE